MNTQAILQQLARIFEDTFMDSAYEFSEDLSSDDIDEWDSLGQIRLLTAIEEAFDVQLDVEQIEKITNVGDIAAAVQQQLAA